MGINDLEFLVVTIFISFQTEQSSETEIILQTVDLDTTGQFRCEISGEAPLFQTAYREGVLAVVGKFDSFQRKKHLDLLYGRKMIKQVLVYSLF